MEVLFKDDSSFYYIENENLDWNFVNHFRDLSNIRHLDDVEVLYHYRNINSGEWFPVYYEYNNRFITKNGDVYNIDYIRNSDIKDYTLVNLNLI